MKKQLEKSSLLPQFETALQDFIDRGVFVPLSREYIQKMIDEDKVVCFTSHHPVVRPDKATTLGLE